MNWHSLLRRRIHRVEPDNMTKRITEAQAFKQLVETWDNLLVAAFAMLGEQDARALAKAFFRRRKSLDDIDATESARTMVATASSPLVDASRVGGNRRESPKT